MFMLVYSFQSQIVCMHFTNILQSPKIEMYSLTHIHPPITLLYHNYIESRIKSIVAARLGIMKASPTIVEEMKNVNISLVISHCEENLSWIAGYIGNNYSLKDITIYSKCDKEVKGLKALQRLSSTINVLRLPNVGRCDHTYAYWIKEQYKLIDAEADGNDIVMFLKDNKREYRKYHPIDLVLSHASKSGFGCVAMPLTKCKKKECFRKSLTPLMQHKRESLDAFKISFYNRLERDDSSAFSTGQYPFFKDWKEEMGFVIPKSESVPVCYRGSFLAQRKQFLNQPEESWVKMEASLSRADNIVEGHYAERIWASALSDNDDESAKAVDEILSPHIAFTGDGCGMKGML